MINELSVAANELIENPKVIIFVKQSRQTHEQRFNLVNSR